MVGSVTGVGCRVPVPKPNPDALRGESRALYDWLRPAGHTTTTSRALREVLLATDGETFYNGRLWTIKSQRIGPGVFRVWLAGQGVYGAS